jgi:hypothetical protein
MSTTVRHIDNDTPNATADDVRTMYKDTPSTGDGTQQGVGVSPVPVGAPGDDPKSGGTPVHPRPSEGHPHS